MARYIYQGTFKDQAGNVVGAATTANSTDGKVYVYLAGTSTAASVYTASSGGTAVNSVDTDDYGHFYFYVDTDDYASTQKFKITLTHANFESKTYDNIVVFGVDQELKSGASPTFDGTNFTGIPYNGIKAADRTGSDTDIVTGTKGTNGQVGKWNADGDLVGMAVSGSDSTVITGTAGDANDFAMFNSDGDIVGSGLAQSEIDYTEVSSNDGDTDVTGAELEELTDSSETTLHSHSAWTYTSQTATTSGTTVELTTSIPSTATTVEVLLNAVSTDANNQPPVIELGDSDGVETASYVSLSMIDTSGAASQSITDGFQSIHTNVYAASEPVSGVCRLTRWDTSEHLWFFDAVIQEGDYCGTTAGTKTLSKALTTIRLNTPGGSDAFNGGEARVRYR